MNTHMILTYKKKGGMHVFEMFSVGQENLRHLSGQESDPFHVFAVTCTKISDFPPVLIEFNEDGKIAGTEVFRILQDGKFEEWLLEKMQLHKQE